MKYFVILLLFLTGCSSEYKIVDKSNEFSMHELCARHVYDAKQEFKASYIKKIKFTDAPDLIFGTRVRLNKGFYKGQVGTVIDHSAYSYFYDNRSHYKYKVQLDKEIPSLPANRLEVFPKDVEVIK